MKKKSFLITGLLATFFLTFTISTAIAQPKDTSAPPPKQAVRKPADPAANNITQAALKAGARTCAGRINQITNYLTTGVNAGYMFFFANANSDQQMTSVSMEIPIKDSSAYASASFAPSRGNYCGGMYETVVYWPNKCSEVAEKQFGTLKRAGALATNIGVRDGGPSLKVFLMPAGTGCVVIKKEMVR